MAREGGWPQVKGSTATPPPAGRPSGFGTTLNEYLKSKKVKFTNKLTGAS
jgi:hypothetical protein